MFRVLSAFLITGLALFGNPVFAASLWINESKLNASDAAEFGSFGSSVAISGDTLVVGAAEEGTNSGSAYVFVRSGETWTEQQELIASDNISSDNFGISVAIDGNTVVVGAGRDDDAGSASGSAYVFVRSGGTWAEQAKLTASDAAAGDLFGSSVAISGNLVVVGAWSDDDGGSQSGSAYVFVRSGTSWMEEAKLTASDAAAGDLFGESVAISGDTVVVASIFDDNPSEDMGSAYVFVREADNTWTEQAKLTANDAAGIRLFGDSVAISGDTVVVGARGVRKFSGAAYIFVRTGTTWAQQKKLTASDGAKNDFFGFSVGISGDTAVVGAYSNDDAGSDSGSAYVFVRSGTSWKQQTKLTAHDAAAFDDYGWSVAVSGETVVVGALADDDGGGNSGSAYVYKLTPNSFQGTLTGKAFCLNSSGTGQKIPVKRITTVSVDTLQSPLITAVVRLDGFSDPFTLTGMALLKNPKSGVLQLFGTDGGSTELALSGTIKLNKKTREWASLKGEIQLLLAGTHCTFAGKFTAK